ncbi:MAG: hypothetical protein IH598_04410 [Bacteroidales bacterium]|nr:hypothetical protein [Bacteroidales bacterium]
MKKILIITVWIVIFAGIMVIFGFAVAEQKKVTCTGAVIILEDNNQQEFINEQDILKIIQQLYNPLEGRYLDSINTGKIAETLNNNPYIREAEVIKSLTGQIKVELSRSEALVRVVNQKGDNFYLGTEGEVMPISKTFIPKILVANGYIPDIPDPGAKLRYKGLNNPIQAKSILPQIQYLAGKLAAHSVFRHSIEQIFVNQLEEIELVPSTGDHIILIGNVSDLDHKLENLLAYYQAGMPKLDTTEHYNVIDLKYKDQVVCKNTIQ